MEQYMKILDCLLIQTNTVLENKFSFKTEFVALHRGHKK